MICIYWLSLLAAERNGFIQWKLIYFSNLLSIFQERYNISFCMFLHKQFWNIYHPIWIPKQEHLIFTDNLSAKPVNYHVFSFSWALSWTRKSSNVGLHNGKPFSSCNLCIEHKEWNASYLQSSMWVVFGRLHSVVRRIWPNRFDSSRCRNVSHQWNHRYINNDFTIDNFHLPQLHERCMCNPAMILTLQLKRWQLTSFDRIIWYFRQFFIHYEVGTSFEFVFKVITKTKPKPYVVRKYGTIRFNWM